MLLDKRYRLIPCSEIVESNLYSAARVYGTVAVQQSRGDAYAFVWARTPFPTCRWSCCCFHCTVLADYYRLFVKEQDGSKGIDGLLHQSYPCSADRQRSSRLQELSTMTIGAACHCVKSQLATKYLALKLQFVDEVRIRWGLEYIVRHSRWRGRD